MRDIFSTDGEDAFRSIESQVLADALASPTPSVIAGAGGVVLRPSNREALRSSGARVVWLCADPATLVERVKGGGHRPLLDVDPAGTLQRMCTERAPLYREVADAIVLVDHRSAADVVEAVRQFFGGKAPATPPAAPRQQAQPSKVVAFPGPVKKPVVKKFGPGSYVTNAKFGRGQVVKIEGSGDDAKITVSFPGHGLKKLVAKYAGIKIE